MKLKCIKGFPNLHETMEFFSLPNTWDELAEKIKSIKKYYEKLFKKLPGRINSAWEKVREIG